MPGEPGELGDHRRLADQEPHRDEPDHADEDHRVAVPDQRGGRHRPGAAPGHHGPAAKPARVAAAQDAEQLVVGKREPVGFGQLTAHAVNGVRALAQAPASATDRGHRAVRLQE